MILEQKLYGNFLDADEIFLKVAEEIKNGYTVSYIENFPFECSVSPRMKSAFAIILRKKGIEYDSRE